MLSRRPFCLHKRSVCCRCDWGCGLGRPAVARQVRDYAEEALDDHELGAVVHLVLLRPLDHLEAALRRRTVWHGHQLVSL